jgi:hypothetical protein
MARARVRVSVEKFERLSTRARVRTENQNSRDARMCGRVARREKSSFLDGKSEFSRFRSLAKISKIPVRAHMRVGKNFSRDARMRA